MQPWCKLATQSKKTLLHLSEHSPMRCHQMRLYNALLARSFCQCTSTYSSCGVKRFLTKYHITQISFIYFFSSCNFWLFTKITNKEEISDGRLRDNELVDGDHKSGFCRLFWKVSRRFIKEINSKKHHFLIFWLILNSRKFSKHTSYFDSATSFNFLAWQKAFLLSTLTHINPMLAQRLACCRHIFLQLAPLIFK